MTHLINEEGKWSIECTGMNDLMIDQEWMTYWMIRDEWSNEWTGMND